MGWYAIKYTQPNNHDLNKDFIFSYFLKKFLIDCNFILFNAHFVQPL